MSFFERIIFKREFLPETHTDPRLKNFTVVGSNSSLTESNVVFVGEVHNYHWLENAGEEALREYSKTIVLSEGSSRDTASLLREIARPGDIVLLEALENGSEVLQRSVGYERLLHKYGSILEGLRLFGWDNMDAYAESRSLLTENALTIAQRNQLGDHEMGKRVRKNLDRVFGQLVRKRNRSMIDTFKQMRIKYPDPRIFIISGPLHYSLDKGLQRALRHQKYIALRPKVADQP